MNIVLIGYRCCGKTSTGKLIAERLGRQFIDTDELIIKKEGCTIDETVSRHGWQYFREAEKGIVRDVSSQENLVIATGGGVVLNEENVRNLKANGFVVWLYADTETIKRRLNEDKATTENRPSLTGEDPSDEITKVLQQRKSLYMAAGDMAVDTSRLDINEVANAVIDKLGKAMEKQEMGNRN